MNIRFERHILKSEERQQLLLPFEIPEGIERIDVRYAYQRFSEELAEGQTTRKEVNIVDLALIAPSGYVGASGSNRGHIHVSSAGSAKGYAPVRTEPGTWRIVAGAYVIREGGCLVSYDIELTPKARRLLKGDLHCHSTASDGNRTPANLMDEAARMGLDFLCISDHNAFSQNDEMAAPPDGLTMLPGMELTHYDGHVNFIGARRPVECPFPVNGRDAMLSRLGEARKNGALVSVNHPFADCDWRFGLDIDMDCVEIWNGGTPPEQNMPAIAWWHAELCKGRRLPIVGGSDFHFTEPMRTLACPATWVYADSREPGDIVAALKAGRGFVTLSHAGPTLWAQAGEAGLGEVSRGADAVRAEFAGLAAGDVVKIITDASAEQRVLPASMAKYTLEVPVRGAKFVRFEVWKPQLPSVGGWPWLISNPVYFEQ